MRVIKQILSILITYGVFATQAHASPCNASKLESFTIQIVQGEIPIPDRLFSVAITGEPCVQKRSVTKIKKSIKVKISKKNKGNIFLQAPFCKLVRIKPKPGKNNVRIKLHCENTPPIISQVSQVIEDGKIKLTFSVFDREGDLVTVLVNGENPLSLASNSTQTIYFDMGMGGSAILLDAADGAQSSSVALRLAAETSVIEEVL